MKKIIMALSLVGAALFGFAEDVAAETNTTATNNVAKIIIEPCNDSVVTSKNKKSFTGFLDETIVLKVYSSEPGLEIEVTGNLPEGAKFDGSKFEWKPLSKETVEAAENSEGMKWFAARSSFQVTFTIINSDKTTENIVSSKITLTLDKRPPTPFQKFVITLKQGGWTMIFLGILSVFGLGCGIERFINLKRSKITPYGFSSNVINLWKQGDFEQVNAICAKDKSALAKVVEVMLQHKDTSDFQQMKMIAEDKASRELRLENRKSSMLSTVATIAPLLGLFGTVLGLLEAFGTVAAVGDMGNPAILADSIGKALVTTVAGLIIAMPSLGLYNLFKNKLNLYAVELEEEVSDIVNHLFIHRNK